MLNNCKKFFTVLGEIILGFWFLLLLNEELRLTSTSEYDYLWKR